MKLSLRRRGVAVGAGAVACLAVASVAVGASTQNPTYNLKALKGSITADGSSTVGPYTTAGAELFRRAGASGVKVTVGISGTGGGFQRFCKGEIDLADASRPMKVSEAAACKTNSVGAWRAFTVANDALTVVVNQQNTWARCLSVAELKKIWEPGSKVNNWKDVRAGFPDVALKLFGAGTDSGTFDYFTEAINGKAKASRSDYQATEDDNVTVQGVSGERGAMGYFGYSYFVENQSRLNAVQIRNPKTDQCVTPERGVGAEQFVQAAWPAALHLREGVVVRAQGSAGVPRLHLRQREAHRDARGLRAAHQAAAQAGADELRPRREGGEQELVSPSDASPVTEGRPVGRPSPLSTRALWLTETPAQTTILISGSIKEGCVLLLRHASAGERLSSPHIDRFRELDEAGRADARQLIWTLADQEIERIVSSPLARCVQSVIPIAESRRLVVERRDELLPDAEVDATLELLAELPDAALVCTHQEVFDAVVCG